MGYLNVYSVMGEKMKRNDWEEVFPAVFSVEDAERYVLKELGIDESLSAEKLSINKIDKLMKRGDLFFSTNINSIVATVINKMSNDVISHVEYYLGNGRTFGAIAPSVGGRSLDEYVSEFKISTIGRVSNITDEKLDKIERFLKSKNGSSYDLNWLIKCGGKRLMRMVDCNDRDADIRKATIDSYFCSELITKAFNIANNDVSDHHSKLTTPGEVFRNNVNKIEIIGYIVNGIVYYPTEIKNPLDAINKAYEKINDKKTKNKLKAAIAKLNIFKAMSEKLMKKYFN